MINRDGATTSLWQQSTNPFAGKNQFVNQEFDVIIAGGGITGLTTALSLQKAGLKCVILEAKTLCFGTTGGTTAHLNTLLDTPYSTMTRNFGTDNAKLVAQFAKGAIELIEKNIGEYNIDCEFQKTSAYLFAQNERQEKELQEIKQSCDEVNVDARIVSAMEWPFASRLALEIPGQAKFHPTRYVMALARAFEELGGLIVENCRVKNAEYKEVILIDSPLGKIYGRHLIYATHIPPGVTHLNLRCAPYRSYAAAFEVDNRLPESLAYDMYDPYHYFRTQTIDGQNYLIAGGEDHKTGHAMLSDDPFKSIEDVAAKSFKIKSASNRWSSQYFESVDGLPYIGKLNNGKASILAASGFGGNGMIYGTVSALILHDIVMEQSNPAIELFTPLRHKPLAAAKNFVKENVDVATRLVRKLLPKKEIKSRDDLTLQEGSIFKVNGHPLAIYRQAKDQFLAIDPACSHMKCEVAWNHIEKSWDCPCHGARYDTNGEVMTGPADFDLKKMEAVSIPEDVKAEG